MIELILNNNGIGVKKVNSFVRQLYVIKQDLSNIEAVASDLKDVSHLPDHAMVFFVFSCSLEQVKPVQAVELARQMPEKDQVMALQILAKEQYWNPITLKENGFIHIAFGFILGIAAWTRGQAQIAQIKNQQ